MASKDSNPLPTKSQTTSPTTKENVTNTTVTPPKTAPSADQGLADLPTSPHEGGRKEARSPSESSAGTQKCCKGDQGENASFPHYSFASLCPRGVD